MSTATLDAELRTDLGKGAARKIRATGAIPAVVYRAGNSATHITLENEELELAFKRTQDRNTLVTLNIKGDQPRTCLVREAVRHPVSREIVHVDFYEVEADQQVDIVVDIEPVGTAKGIKMGGRLRVIRRALSVRCKPADIPARIRIDVTQMAVGDFIRVGEVTPPSGCEFVFKSDFNVLAVIGKRGAKGQQGAEAAGA
ncbi:MAG: 50S ribosomal protein L25 [Alphaproteobacteria bacterium]|nr:50S ribosomal protein L25 [Alphaproteobacteria bacterium]